MIEMQEWAEFWWERITGAKMVVESVTKALQDSRIVVLDVPEDLPWRREMRSVIENNLRKTVLSENNVIQTIDDTDERRNNDIGDFLLKRYCRDPLIQNGYRPESGKSIQEYLIENKVLHNTVIWVKGVDRNSGERWLNFCKGYKRPSITTGIIVLELKEFNGTPDSGNMEAVHFNQLVSDYDVQLLNSFVLDNEQGVSQRFSNGWKRYISAVAASLCGSDAEISTMLLDSVDFTRENPIDKLCEIEKNYPQRGSIAGSKHVLSYFRAGQSDELEKRVWNAQIQVLFPLIEKERVKIIEYYHNEIKNTLENEYITQFNEALSNPEEVELGTLDFLVKSYKINMPNQCHRERISFLHTCRNDLAHMKCMAPEDITNLLDEVSPFN